MKQDSGINKNEYEYADSTLISASSCVGRQELLHRTASLAINFIISNKDFQVMFFLPEARNVLALARSLVLRRSQAYGTFIFYRL